MKQLKISIALLPLIMSPSVAFAQKVIRDDQGRVIIDSRSCANATDVKKPQLTDGSSTTFGTNDHSNIGSKVSDAEVYHYLELHKSDNTVTTRWQAAVEVCTRVTTDGDGWRLPTISEIKLIWDCRNEIKTMPNFTQLGDCHYWSATEFNATSNYSIYFENGKTVTNSKSGSYNMVRCVRDVTPPQI